MLTGCTHLACPCELPRWSAAGLELSPQGRAHSHRLAGGRGWPCGKPLQRDSDVRDSASSCIAALPAWGLTQPQRVLQVVAAGHQQLPGAVLALAATHCWHQQVLYVPRGRCCVVELRAQAALSSACRSRCVRQALSRLACTIRPLLCRAALARPGSCWRLISVRGAAATFIASIGRVSCTLVRSASTRGWNRPCW